MEKIIYADGIILGTPIYFGAESGLFRNFMERLLFPLLQYTLPPSSAAPKHLETAMVYTMNIPEEALEAYGYREYLDKNKKFYQLIFNSYDVEDLYVCDTWQFDNYAKYESSFFDADHKADVRKNIFPEYQKKAFELGKKMALK
jgi:multimeric flavodoxin WrbA